MQDILAGIINRQPNTPDTNSSSESSNIDKSGNGLYRVANGGEDNGGGGDDPDGDGLGDNASVGGDNHGRNGRRREFILAKASNENETSGT